MIADNLRDVQQNINEAAKVCGRDPKEIKLVAVSKMHPVSAIEEAMEAGQFVFGENKVQEMTDKMDELADSEIEWHMVGNLQTNKIKYLAPRAHWIHSIEKTKYLKELEKRASREERTLNVLIQVNISDEKQKGGCTPDQLPDILNYAAENGKHYVVRGLMGIASFEEDLELVRPQFQLLRELRDKYADQFKDSDAVHLTELSMGMTHDMSVAIEEGATMVRVGTAIFGERDYGD